MLLYHFASSVKPARLHLPPNQQIFHYLCFPCNCKYITHVLVFRSGKQVNHPHQVSLQLLFSSKDDCSGGLGVVLRVQTTLKKNLIIACLLPSCHLLCWTFHQLMCYWWVWRAEGLFPDPRHIFPKRRGIFFSSRKHSQINTRCQFSLYCLAFTGWRAVPFKTGLCPLTSVQMQKP